MREFISNLAPKLNDFLRYKNAFGIKSETAVLMYWMTGSPSSITTPKSTL